MFLRTDDGAMFPNPAARLSPKLEASRSIADAFRLLGSMLGVTASVSVCCAAVSAGCGLTNA